MTIQESAEMYLESILVISKEKGLCRSVDICEYMNYSKPSVSRAVKQLSEGGYILLDDNKHIFLTEIGKDIAEKMYERHILISRWLINIGVDKDIAIEDACKIEHVISHNTFEALKKHFNI